MGTQAHCPKRGKTRVTKSVREVTHVVYFSLSLAPTDAFPPFFPMRKTDYFSFSALKNSTTRPALTPLCLRCIILCLECMFYSRFYFKSWTLSFSFLLFSYEILVSFIRLSWKKVLYSCTLCRLSLNLTENTIILWVEFLFLEKKPFYQPQNPTQSQSYQRFKSASRQVCSICSNNLGRNDENLRYQRFIFKRQRIILHGLDYKVIQL